VIEKETQMKKLFGVWFFFLAYVATGGAQERAPGLLSESEIITQTRAALRDNTEMFLQQQASLETLLEGQLLPDVQETLAPTAPTDERSFPETLHDSMGKTAVQLAHEESEYAP
jgi:hypothetical protein